MAKSTRNIIPAAALVALSIVASACSAPLESTPTPTESITDPALASARDMYYEAAVEEGEVVIYGGDEPALFDPVRKAFEALFPRITVQQVDQSGRITREKVRTEQQAGEYTADVAISGGNTTLYLLENGYSDPYLSPQISELNQRLVPASTGLAGRVNPYDVTLISVAVNKDLVPPEEEPRSWEDVLDPKWRGRLVISDPRGGGGGDGVIGGVEMTLGREWSSALAEQDVTIAEDGVAWTGLVRGEYAMFLSANHRDAIVQRQEGAPIKFLKLKEGIATGAISQTVIKNAPHPNAAKLWIEFSLSTVGQAALAKAGQAVVRPGITSDFPEASLEGVTFLPDTDTPEADQEIGDLESRSTRWQKLLGIE